MNELIIEINKNYDLTKKIIEDYNLLYKSYYFDSDQSIHSDNPTLSEFLTSFDDNLLYKFPSNIDDSVRRKFFINKKLESKLSLLKVNYLANLGEILRIYSRLYDCASLFDDKWIKVKNQDTNGYVNSISGADMEDKRFKTYIKELYKFGDSINIKLDIQSYEMVDYDEDVEPCEKIFFCTVKIPITNHI